MKLNEKEKECLQLLTEWGQQGIVHGHRDEVIKELGIDGTVYKPLMKKMEEIGAVKIPLQGMGIEFAEQFEIQEQALFQEIWQTIDK